MKVFYGTDGVASAFVNPVVTTGSFDGVHYGHRVLLGELKKKASGVGGESVVVTFSPHPRCVLTRGGDIKLLNTLEEKIFLLEELGIDNLVVLPFNEEFSRLSSEEFVQSVLSASVGVHTLVLGYDHRFGCDGGTDDRQLERLGKELGFDICRIGRQDVGDRKVSSTVVRNTIIAGDMSDAADYLTRPYIMFAVAKDGYLTVANPAKLLPPSGSYGVTVLWQDRGVREERVLEITSGGAIRLGGDVPDGRVLVEFCKNSIFDNKRYRSGI